MTYTIEEIKCGCFLDTKDRLFHKCLSLYRLKNLNLCRMDQIFYSVL